MGSAPARERALDEDDAELGDDEASRAHAAELLEEHPDFGFGGHVASLHYRDEADANACRDSLLKAGLPA